MNTAIPVALSLSGLLPPDGSDDPRALIDWAASLSVRSIQLDATARGFRPRDLDHSARRDLASILRRRQVSLAGVDAFIPPRHLADPATLDRAASAILGAIQLAADLATVAAGRPVVAFETPASLADDVVDQFAIASARLGVTLADHRRSTPAPGQSPSAASAKLGLGIDPAALLAAGEDVFDTVTKLTSPPEQARLSDHDGAARVHAGSHAGRLDLPAYAAALSVVGYDRPVVADLRGVPGPAAAAPRVLAAWNCLSSITGAG